MVCVPDLQDIASAAAIDLACQFPMLDLFHEQDLGLSQLPQHSALFDGAR